MSKLYSASEIAKMQLPGMPTSKVAIATKAKREMWPYAEETGLGGVRFLYQIPPRYLEDKLAKDAVEGATAIAGTIAGGYGKADPVMLGHAVMALEQHLEKTGEVLVPERKGAVISILYNLLISGIPMEEVQEMLTVVMH